MDNQFIQKLIKLIKKNYIQIAISLIFIISITKSSILIPNHKKSSSSFFPKKINNNNNNKNYFHRNLFENSSKSPKTEFNYNEDYMFLTNISFYNYFGKWWNLQIKDNFFSNSEGESQIAFYQTFDKNYITNIENSSEILLLIELIDGKFRDSIIRLNFTINFPNDFNKILKDSIKNNKSITLNSTIKNMNVFYIEMFNDLDVNVFNNETEIKITFNPIEKFFDSNFNYEMTSTLFSQIEISISNKKEYFSISLNGSMEKTNDINNIKNILNCSIILTF